MKLKLISTLFLAAIGTASAQIIPINFNPGDTTAFDGWNNLNTGNPALATGYGGFPGTGSWAGPIGSNVAGSGDANLNKVANGAGGGPFVGGSSIYFGGFSSVPNTLGGTLGVTDNSIISDLNTVVFQVEIGEASGFALFNDAAPTLLINGSTPVALQFNGVISRVDTGETFENPETGELEPIFIDTLGFQWDLSGVVEPITSLSIQFSGVQHSQVYGLQLNQSSGVYTESLVVPEPTSIALVGAGLVLAFGRRRRSVV